MQTPDLSNDAIRLLQRLISTPSLSREEDATAEILVEFFNSKGINANRHLNNVWTLNKYFDESKKTILLNSHHDTVKPTTAYTRDPYDAKIENGKLFGLGSNDAGGSLVSLIACFLHFYESTDLPFNLIISATAEEEISGANGIESLLPQLPDIYVAIVGEPTGMQVAVAEKGLMVIDCIAFGIAGHAARDEGENAIYKAIGDIEWFRHFEFDKLSAMLGPVKMNVTSIHTPNTAHNVVPSECHFVVDVRATDMYSLEEILKIIREHVGCTVMPRTVRLKPSWISVNHPMVIAATRTDRELYGSPTLSDQALLSVDSIKCGPGESERSHTADEFIYLKEIEEGIEIYIRLLNEYSIISKQLNEL
ncbi:MAG: M20/M25/M40 family metallo-hydrolase [Chitinophagaceae bacterium]